MKVIHFDQIELTPVAMEGAVDCSFRCLIGEPDGAPSFSMRQFEVAPGGHTPRHRHAWEHEAYVLSGRGTVVTAEGQQPIRTGDVVLVPAEDDHQFLNTGNAPLRFLCLIPARHPPPS